MPWGGAFERKLSAQFKCLAYARLPPPSGLTLIGALYKHGVFDDFPKISDHFPKISENFPKLFRRPDEHSRTFSENFRKFPKIAEDCRRLPRKTGRCFDDTPTNLRDKLDITEVIDIFTCEDIISSHVRISYRFYEFVTTRYTTDFSIIIENKYRVRKEAFYISSA